MSQAPVAHEAEPITVVLRQGSASKSLTVYGAELESLRDEIAEHQSRVRRRTVAVDRRVIVPPTEAATSTAA